MSEHAWTLENLAAFVAGGLEPAERERLTHHAGECADCGRALADARRADRQLMALFADVRPGATLEDRLIRTLRKPRHAARRRMSALWIKASLAMAAVALLAVLGAGVTALIDNDWVPEFADSTRAPAAGVIGGITHHGANWNEEDELSRSASTYFGVKKEKYGTMGLGTGTMAGHGKPFQHLEYQERAPSPEELAAEIYKENDSLAFKLQTKREQHLFMLDNSKSMEKADVSVPGPVKPNEAVGIKPGNLLTRRQVNGTMDGADLPPLAPVIPTPAPSDGRTKESHKEPPAADLYFAPPLASRGERPAPDEPPGKRLEGDKASQQRGRYTRETTPPDKRHATWGLLPEGPRTATEPGGEKKSPLVQPKPPQPQPQPRYIIRTGEIEFEVDSFDAAAAIVRKLVIATKGAIVATENSDRLANGKVRGAIVVRMPPEHLDQFVLDLRKQLGKAGELKGQKITSQDVSKTYIDLESRLKAARTMEQRLLKIIKDGKGEIKDLVAAEKELGVWNTKIEELEGELRYYQNLISLSTLTINLQEKEIRVAAAVRETERVQAGIEVEEVETAMREVLKAVDDAKGRVTRSEMKQYTGGQFNALLEFDVTPDKAGPIRDRLNQLGTIARLEIDRVQTAEGGEKLPQDGKLERGRTKFIVSLYNLANITPQETVVLRVAAADVAEAYRTVRAAILKASGRIMGAGLEQTSPQQVGANLTFAVPREGEAAIRAALGEAGEVLTRSVSRVAAPAGTTDKDQARLVTDKKVEYRLELISATAIEPRETVAIAVEVNDVEQTLDVLTAKVKELKGRVMKGPESAHELNGRVTAFVVYEVPLSAEPALAEKLRNSGQVRAKKTVPNQQAPEGKLAVARFNVTLANAEVLVPREEGIVAQVRNGLSYSLRGLSVSVSVLIVGVLFVLPWVVLIAAVWWLVRRVWGKPAVTAATPPTTPAASA